MYTIPVRSAIIICHCVELTLGNVVWDMLALLFGTAFLVLISIQTSVSLFSLEVLKQQYVTAYFNWSHVLHVLLMYNYWWCHFMSFWDIFFCCTLCTPVKIYILAKCETDKEPINPTGFPAPFAPMIIYCCIFTGIYSLCWYDYTVYCVWWEAIKLFWILNLE